MSLTKNMDNAKVKETIIDILRSVNRDGIEKVIEFLNKSDFFVAPASTRFHLACEGGLARHSLNVYFRLLNLYTAEKDVYGAVTAEEYATAQESIAICGLLHDVCKIGIYKPSTRNVKNEKTGQWEKVPTYTIDNPLPYGHGEKSVYMLSGFIKLTREEAIAIRWHMGGFDDAAKSYDLTAAFDKYPLAVLLHAADMLASHIDESAPEA